MTERSSRTQLANSSFSFKTWPSATMLEGLKLIWRKFHRNNNPAMSNGYWSFFSGLIVRVPADLRPVFLRRPPGEAGSGAAEVRQGEEMPGGAGGGKEVPQVGQGKIVFLV